MMKTSKAVTDRLRAGAMISLTLALMLGIPSASAANDPACQQNASRDLTNELNQAYNAYSQEMQQITDALAQNEQRAYAIMDQWQQYGLLNQARQTYAYGQSEANNRLGSKVYQAWNTYYSKQSYCYASNSSSSGNSNSYNYQYQQYPYNQQQYGNQYYQYQQYYSPYQQQSYNYNYNYNQGYGYSSSVQYYNNYGVQYNNNGQYICPQVVMSTLPSGCGYDCSLDSSGCRRCEISCRRSAQRTESCGCAQTFRPVCGKDGVTYTNECFADCAGVEVRKMNVCN